jgi:hypothetical protein
VFKVWKSQRTALIAGGEEEFYKVAGTKRFLAGILRRREPAKYWKRGTLFTWNPVQPSKHMKMECTAYGFFKKPSSDSSLSSGKSLLKTGKYGVLAHHPSGLPTNRESGKRRGLRCYRKGIT